MVSNLQKSQDKNVEAIYPLSPMQEGMLFHTLYAPESEVYFEQFTYGITGNLDVKAFHQAWQKLVDRHPVLRTLFLWKNRQQPLQVVRKQAELPWIFEDWRSLSPQEQQTQLTVFLKSDRQQGFELNQAPLMRCKLIQLADQTYYIVWSSHHILSDGWCLPIIFKELFTFYESLSRGQTLSLPTSRPYRDYITWLQKQDLDKAETFWRSQLKGFIAATPLVVDHLPSSAPSSNLCQQESLQLSALVTAQLQALVKRHRLTLNTIVQGAWALLLSRYSGESDIVFGATVSGRPPELTGVESMVGLFINTLPVRVKIPQEGKLIPWLETLRAQQVEIEQYAYSPLVDIQHWSDIVPGTPLFNSILVFENYPIDPSLMSATKLKIERISGVEQNNYPLTVSAALLGDELLLHISYETCRFDSATIQRMLGHWQTLLVSMLQNPDTGLKTLPLLTEAERKELLVDWNDTAAKYAKDKCIHQLFEEQVGRTPDAVAVVYEEQQLTYQELNQKANQLAHYLQKLGVKPDTLVGISVERSLEMMIGLLGILKAGGAYVPIDPNYPRERIDYILQESNLVAILTQEALFPQFSYISTPLICLDGDELLLNEEDKKTIDHLVQPEHLAYTIYTSGSTGKPKGVQVTHRNIINHNYAIIQAYCISQQDRVLQFASLNFDVAVEEIFPTLLTGARVVLSSLKIPSFAQFNQLIQQYHLTVLNLPTSYWYQWLSAIDNSDVLSSLRLVVVGSEAVPMDGWLRWQQLVGTKIPCYNAYGLSETTITATIYRPSVNESRSFVKPSTVPIGKPINNTQIYILNEYLQPVPVGVPGELYIGGDGVAKGYLNRTDLTIERFINNPFLDNSPVKLYKTGDICRYLPDGNIEYVERKDFQVKIRGLRIELGEIEAQLNQHPSVQQAVVVIHQSSEQPKPSPRIVAYIVSYLGTISTDENRLSHSLREYLKEKLPDYMIPSAFVQVEKLPLSPNGKIDRKALPAPNYAWVCETEDFVLAQTPQEKTIAQIWSDLLRIDKISIHSNFFELGGDSILSIQVVARANQAGLKITPKQLFEYQTISELALVAESLKSLTAEQGLVTGTAPLTPIEHWFFAENLANPHHDNQAILLEVSPEIDSKNLTQVFDKLLEHHDVLRLRFPKIDQEWQQYYKSSVVSPKIQEIDLTSLTKSEQTTAIEAQANQGQSSLNLVDGPILRVILFKLGHSQSHRLLIIIHHLAVDGVSWRILLEDLVTAYQQLSQGKAVQLPAKTTSYKQWGEKLVEYAQSDQIKAQLTYWLSQNSSQELSLPVDKEVGLQANTQASAVTLKMKLSTRDTQVLLQEVPGIYHTQINDILLTALVQSVGEWVGKASLLLDLEGHGREDLFESIDLSRTVGWFTSIFPVKLTLTPKEKEQPGKAIKSIKEQLRKIPQKGISYGILKYLSSDLSIREKLSQQPRPQISFNYLGQFDQMLNSPPILGLGSESIGNSCSPQNTRSHLIALGCMVVSGELELDWKYSENLHDRESIEQLAQSYLRNLQALIVHCQSPEAGGFTPSDFPEIDLNQQELEDLLAEFTRTQNKNIEAIYPLSPMQNGMLFHSLYDTESEVYFEQFSFEINSHLSIEFFHRAWQIVVDRHSVLRTVFLWENCQQPLQMVMKKVELPWRFYEWQSLSVQEQTDRFEELLRADRQQKFDFKKAPLMRCILIQISAQSYNFVWSSHHILSDGWCLPIIIKEVLSFYEAFCQGQTLLLPKPRPYKDYIAWLQQQDLNKAERFWRENLKGFTTPTPLIVERLFSLKTEAKITHSQQSLKLSPAVTENLQNLVRQHRITLNTIIQGAWAILLSRYSGESDVIFGTTLSGRPPELTGVESIVGLFINTLPVRVIIPDDTTVIPWLQNLRTQQVEREQYFYTPLVEIKKWSEVSQGMSLFDSILVFENYPIDGSLKDSRTALGIRSLKSFEQTNYSLGLLIVPDQELALKISYDGSRFEDATIERFLDHLQVLLEAMIANPEENVSKLPFLTAGEKQQILVEWNDTATDYPKDKCIHQLFAEQVERTPDAVAVVYQEQQLTYQELNQKANQLAHYLQKLGVKPDTLVGICVERSLEMIIGLLGILKAGGAYVPIDPNYPSERISYMLSDSQVGVLLTQESVVETLPTNKAQIICLDSNWLEIEAESVINPDSPVIAENLAYVIYTSGSTGKPKGVMIQHQGVANLAKAQIGLLQVYPSSRVLQFASFSFDASASEIVMALLSGARLVLAPKDDLLPGNNLEQIIHRYGITHITLPPSSLTVMSPDALSELETIIVAGEACPSELAALWSKGRNFFNGYGPTEDTVCATMGQYQEDLDKLPIGKPLPNTQVYILDFNLQPVPMGVAGELHIGGDGLARGYLNRPELTCEKFINNPFDPKQESRLYKTGDLCRYLADGNLEYIGRIDDQVKIRGFRIELAEIEFLLSAHPDVREAVVIAREDQPGNKRLVAYVVPSLISDSQNSLSQGLREYLKEKLPDYMIPSAFVLLEKLPLNPNGKVDRKVLPVPDALNRDQDKSYLPPRDGIEQKLLRIWEKVLSVAPIGLQDNFFDLGGHSLLAVRLISSIQHEFQQQLPLASLFQSPTPEKMADLLRSSSNVISWSPLVPIQTQGSYPPFFCIPGVGGNVIYLYELARELGSNQPFYGLQAVELDESSQETESIESMATRYLQLIQTVQPQGPYLLGGHSFGGIVAFEMAKQLYQQGETINLLAIFDTQAPIIEQELFWQDWDETQWMVRMAGVIGELLNTDLEISRSKLEALTRDEQIQCIYTKLQEVNFIPPHGDLQQVRLLTATYKKNLQIATRYVSKNPFPLPITLFRSKDDQVEHQEEQDISWGWQQLTTDNVITHWVSGSHITMMTQPHVKGLAQLLSNQITQVNS